MAQSPRKHDNGQGRPQRETAYTSYRWRKASEVWRQQHPHCVLCGSAAQLVDHIIPHDGDEQRFWDRSNWRSLCHKCHGKKTHGTYQPTTK